MGKSVFGQVSIAPRGGLRTGDAVLGFLLPTSLTQLGTTVLASPGIIGEGKSVNPLISKGVSAGAATVTHMFLARSSFTLGWWVGEMMDFLGQGTTALADALVGQPAAQARRTEFPALRGVIGRRFGFEQGGVIGRRFGFEQGQASRSELEELRRLRERLSGSAPRSGSSSRTSGSRSGVKFVY